MSPTASDALQRRDSKQSLVSIGTFVRLLEDDVLPQEAIEHAVNSWNDAGKLMGGIGKLIINEKDLDLKKDRLRVLALDVKTELECYVAAEDSVDLGIMVNCKVNDKPNLMVLRRKDEADINGGIEIYLEDNSSCKKLAPKAIKNFSDVYERLKLVLEPTEDFYSESEASTVEVVDCSSFDGPEDDSIENVDSWRRSKDYSNSDESEVENSSWSWPWSKAELKPERKPSDCLDTLNNLVEPDCIAAPSDVSEASTSSRSWEFSKSLF